MFNAEKSDQSVAVTTTDLNIGETSFSHFDTGVFFTSHS